MARWPAVWVAGCVCACAAQLEGGTRADLTFSNYNDRFDVANIIQEQNRQFRDAAMPMDYDEDSRRRARDMPLVDVLKQDRRRYQRAEQQRRAYGGSEEEFIHSWQPRMVDQSEELEKYNTNLENFRRQKPSHILSRRYYDKNIYIPALDNIRTFDNPNEDIQGVIVEKHKSKNKRRNHAFSEPTNVQTNHNSVPNTNQNIEILKKIDTKGRRNNEQDRNNRDRNKPSEKDLEGVIFKYLHGGRNIKNRRRAMTETNSNDETLLKYAVPLRMTVRGYVELPNV